jgi:DUF1680 family protein
MLQQECHAQYADLMERALYNGVLSSVSQDGTGFFYVNPLAAQEDHARQPWFDCACCPTNITRLLASLGQYIYSYNEQEIAVHLYVQGTARLTLQGEPIVIRQEGNYPWGEQVALTVEVNEPTRFALKLRLPGWCSGASLLVNGEPLDADAVSEHGYMKIERVWEQADRVSLQLPMPPVRLYAYPEIAADVGQVALQRGPLVYCLEGRDQEVPLQRITLPRTAEIEAQHDAHFQGEVVTLGAGALALDLTDWKQGLYRKEPPRTVATSVRAIPYYLWCNRGAATMRVWMHEQAT